jgi:phage terminase large subunit-like protein
MIAFPNDSSMIDPIKNKSPRRLKQEKILKKLLVQEYQRRQKNKKLYDWNQWARPEQRIPQGLWKTWLILAGRGFGKTRTGAETIRHWVTQKGYKRVCLLGETLQDVRQVMIEGESGLLKISPPQECPIYEPSKRQLTWPNGAIAIAYSADAYEQLRGPQFDCAWVDELAKFYHQDKAWDQLMMGLRLGKNPRVIVTTTPRPTALLKQMIHDPSTVLSRGTTFDNATNLSQNFIESVQKRYGHTIFGRQEISGEMVEEQAHALWKTSWITYKMPPPHLHRIIVSIDPAVSYKAQSDETGIIVAGLCEENHVYVLADYSGRYEPNHWIQHSVKAYETHQADRIIAEINNGGDLVESLLRNTHPHISYKGVRATRDKYCRAEPVAALYSQGKIFHAQPFCQLEAQMLSYDPRSSKSPDRMDALVWAVTELLLTQHPKQDLKAWSF